MDGVRFDAVARLLGNGLTRRRALRGVVGAAAAAVGGAALGGATAEAAKDRCKKAGKPCTSSKQCCRDKKLICDVESGAGNSDETCCGKPGATCGGADGNGDAVGPLCCQQFSCSTGDIDDPDFQPRKKGKCQR